MFDLHTHQKANASGASRVEDAIDGLVTGLGPRLRRWIGSGACQSDSGAFCAWRDWETGSLSFEYPEITGYSLTFLAGRSDLSAREAKVGRRAADWLVHLLLRGELAARADWDGGAVYNFDQAIIASGLMSFGNRVGSAEYVRHGLSLVENLRDQLTPGGSLSPIRGDYPPSTRPPCWSTHGQAHMLKVVQAFLLADAIGAPGFDEAAAMIVERHDDLQSADGRFRTQPRDDVTMLHPHSYAIEGLWVWGTARRDAYALARGRTALEWLWAQQLETGGFPRSVGGSCGSNGPERAVEQSDVTCQAVRMALAFELEPARLGDAITRIGQIARGDDRAAAIIYQPASRQLHLNTWATLFAAQAMGMIGPNKQALTWQELV